jgi:chaperonin cofactor prefoldin
MLRDGSTFALFNSSDELLQRFESVTTELAPYFAQLFDFHLPLKSKKGESTQATPAFMFIPFYVDQDKGWTDRWTSFTRLQQFSDWKLDVAQYHMGIRPNAYYEAKARLSAVQAEIQPLEIERRSLGIISGKISEILADAEFDIDIEAFKKEIEELLVYANSLRTAEESLKVDLSALYVRKQAVEEQIQIVQAAVHELNADYEFATTAGEKVDCPTCGAHYENGFAERFAIASDEDRCEELLSDLHSQREVIDSKITALNRSVQDNRTALGKVQAHLHKKRGELTLSEIIQTQGRKEVRTIVRSEMYTYDRKISELRASVETLRREMKALDDKTHRKSIEAEYVATVRRYLARLQIYNVPETKYAALESTIQESGSSLPRAILGQLYAVLSVINRHSTATYCPIVIDSPRQQDQDPANWKRILEFIREFQPSESQLILGLVEDEGVDFGGEVIDLTEKFRLLQASEYNKLWPGVQHLLLAAFSN